jgi:methanogenic corrinoid protein MtbC1
MKTKNIHPIKHVALQTGLKPYLIRTWEERYGAVRPERSPSNRRLYSDADIQRLKLLKTAVACGHSISSAVLLSDNDLVMLVQRSTKTNKIFDYRVRVQSNAETKVNSKEAGRCVQSALSCIRQLDSLSLEKVLSDAAVEMPRQSFLQLVILPLFNKVGELWREGKIKIVNEHMASTVVRSMLWDMLRALEVPVTAPKMVIATPVGHYHEFGALASALAASESGWQVFYFGPNLPAEEIAYAVKKMNARVLTLSLCHRLVDNKLTLELKKIRRLVGMHTPLFIGGPGVTAAGKTIEEIRAMVVNDLGEFRQKLDEFTE